VVHAGAGRTCHVDGGIAFCGFRLEDGATAWAHKGGLRNDVPVSDGSDFYVQGYRLSADRPRLRDPGQHGRRDLPPWHEDRPKGPVLEGKRLGLLDATITLFPPWLVEYRMQHKHLMGCTYAGTRAWLAVWDDLDAFYYDTDLSQRQTPGAQRLRASKLLASKGQPATAVWSLDLPADVRVDSLLVTSDALVAAGARGVGTEAPEGLVWVYARRDGAEQQEVALPGLPAYQSLAAVPGRLFVSTRDGSLICLEGVSE
jgi:hypothetical protein